MCNENDISNSSESNIAVSVLCTAYNHEKYIRECLDGFMMQKTNFKFEVIIHDDASTDKTAEIIREYAMKYPDIIKPIYQSVNQYSQGINIFGKWMLPRVKGKYLAFCEGDDYWIDENKLQKQYDVMESDYRCRFCVHKVSDVYEDGRSSIFSHPSFKMNSGIMRPEQYFEYYGREWTFQLSSYFLRSNDFKTFLDAKFDFTMEFAKISVLDQPILMYFGQLGNTFYFGDVMSCYRRMSVGSWTSRQREKGLEYSLYRYSIDIHGFELFDQFSEGRYHLYLQRKIDDFNFSMDWNKAVLSGARCDYKLLYKKIRQGVYGNEVSFRKKIKVFFCAYCPLLYRILKCLKDHFVS